MQDDGLAWLQRWYISQCDGDWEHSEIIRIETLDNPGWSLRVDIKETELFGELFEEITLECGNDDWVHARVRDGRFEAFGGPSNLSEMIGTFRGWVERR